MTAPGTFYSALQGFLDSFEPVHITSANEKEQTSDAGLFFERKVEYCLRVENGGLFDNVIRTKVAREFHSAKKAEKKTKAREAAERLGLKDGRTEAVGEKIYKEAERLIRVHRLDLLFRGIQHPQTELGCDILGSYGALRVVFQCKFRSKGRKLSPSEVDNIPMAKILLDADEAILITNTKLSADAATIMKRCGVHVFDREFQCFFSDSLSATERSSKMSNALKIKFSFPRQIRRAARDLPQTIKTWTGRPKIR